MPPKVTKTGMAKMALKRQITGKPPRLFKEINQLQRAEIKNRQLLDIASAAHADYRNESDISMSQGGDLTGSVERAYGRFIATRDTLRSHDQKQVDMENVIKGQVTTKDWNWDDNEWEMMDYYDNPHYKTGKVWEDIVEKDVYGKYYDF